MEHRESITDSIVLAGLRSDDHTNGLKSMASKAARTANRKDTIGQRCVQSFTPQPYKRRQTRRLSAAVVRVAEQQRSSGLVCAAAIRKQQLSTLVCATTKSLRYDQIAYGGMPFGHGAGDSISQGFHATPAPLRPGHRSPAARNRAVCGYGIPQDSSRVC